MRKSLITLAIALMGLSLGCNNKQEDASESVGRPVAPTAPPVTSQLGGTCGSSYVQFQATSEQAVRAMLDSGGDESTGGLNPEHFGDIDISTGVSINGRVYYRKSSEPVGQAMSRGNDGQDSKIAFQIRDSLAGTYGEIPAFGIPLTSGWTQNYQVDLTFDDGKWLAIRVRGTYDQSLNNMTAQVSFINHKTSSSEIDLGRFSIKPCAFFIAQ